jgi:hypothetical protein
MQILLPHILIGKNMKKSRKDVIGCMFLGIHFMRMEVGKIDGILRTDEG